jgi:Glycosyl transferase family, helical bundle domain
MVDWIGLAISDAKGKVTYDGAFLTSLRVTRENVAEIAACARARWKIENESFNVLKNNGYHLEHNFGHGKENLAMMFAAMNLLAFASAIAWKTCGSRRARQNAPASASSNTSERSPPIWSFPRGKSS